jgi:DNA-binding transcriptional LysR family regulator
MDAKDLRYFAVVYETGNFSRASEVLATVQSNVSARIHHLEETLGAPLFERRYRRIEPTELAERLYQYVKPLIVALDRIEELFRVPRG